MKKLTFNKNHNKWFLSSIRNLIDKYNLINKDENIGFALSGGKDSVTLLYILAYLKKFSSLKFNITAFHIKIFDNDTTILKNYCFALGIKYLEKKTELPKNEKNVCYYCSKNRRMIIKNIMKKQNIKKVVFAHNKNDLLETFLMNLVLHKRIETIKPISCSNDFCVIRPMLDLDKKTINSLHRYFNLPFIENRCPYQIKNKRQLFRNWINENDDEIKRLLLKNITEALFL